MAGPSPLLLSSLVALLLAAPAPAIAAGGRVLVRLRDAARDATGPGSYVPPTDGGITGADFDLRAFEVRLDGDVVVFEVTLAAPFRRPEVTARTTRTPQPLTSGIWLQNIDIYVDTDPTPGVGSDRCIPGRRVTFADGRTWERAIVLTPRPETTRAIARKALGAAGRRVIVPRRLVTQGRRVIARVPVTALGGPPRATWAYSVHVSGARWERTFGLLAHDDAPDAFTMPVLPLGEPWAFGGAPEGNAHPRVVDVLLPAGVDQKAVLGSFDAKAGAHARVPFVGGAPPPARSP